MWRLDEFQYDHLIPVGEVSVLDDSLGDESVCLPRDEAIATAHALGLNLVAWWPGQGEADVSCVFRKVTLPLRWETLPKYDGPLADERMWFEAFCGNRDFLLDDNGHTFHGRMLAWCPDRGYSYSVSLDEMGEMSTESEYFVRGFLAGNSPEGPFDESDEITPEDETAWILALQRFRQTGSWFGRWGTCAECGCVLLPDTASDRCGSHSA